MSKYFTNEELACKCGCGFTITNEKLLNTLDAMREIYGKPVVIASGARCEHHNSAVGGVPDSAHMKGLAVDIVAESGQEKFNLLNLIFTRNLFKRVGIDKHFIHVDVDDQKPQFTVWTYPVG